MKYDKQNKFRKKVKTNADTLESLTNIAKKVEHESALIRIGKSGSTQTLVLEIQKLVRKKKAVKVKILQNAAIEDTNLFFKELESEVGYEIWRTKGNTATFIEKKLSQD